MFKFTNGAKISNAHIHVRFIQYFTQERRPPSGKFRLDMKDDHAAIICRKKKTLWRSEHSIHIILFTFLTHSAFAYLAETSLMLIVEYCHFGDLQSYLRHCRGIEDKCYVNMFHAPVQKMNSRDLLSFAIQVARGMAHLAGMKVWYVCFLLEYPLRELQSWSEFPGMLKWAID